VTTKIYGASDDLIEFDGDVKGEIDHWQKDDNEPGVLLMCSDCTVLEVRYGKGGEGIWGVKLLRQGSLFDRIDICTDADDDPYSDVAHFRPGLKWAYAAKEWEVVR
jgi:hypothetical protein